MSHKLERQPCATCPYRTGSRIAYDNDALEALDAGYEPSCHQVVGADRIFAVDCPDAATYCVGYERWITEQPGYQRPAALDTDE